jgi:hypothetical protein
MASFGVYLLFQLPEWLILPSLSLTVPDKFPSSGSRTRHALVDDIGNPAVPEQEDYGRAGD